MKKQLGLRYEPLVYSNLGLAKASLEHMVKSCWVIVLGDNCKFWVVCFADAAKLERLGYEII